MGPTIQLNSFCSLQNGLGSLTVQYGNWVIRTFPRYPPFWLQTRAHSPETAPVVRY